MLDSETADAVSADRIRYGQRVVVIAFGCDPIWRTERGITAAGPRAFGYDFDFVPGVCRAFEIAIRYAQERRSFGVPIAAHQAVSFMIAAMAMSGQGDPVRETSTAATSTG